MTICGDTDEDGGVTGERDKSEEVIEGGDSGDLSGILIGFAKLEEHVSEGGGEGESDRSLLVSLLLSSEYMMLLRILSSSTGGGV
ncbi:MAG: hypothetical protein Q9166_003606 [cf. Caloplaca sp. 2 TL-2023]